MRILFDRAEKIEAKSFSSSDENSNDIASIYCNSPYIGTPIGVNFSSSLWLDNNVMRRITASKKNENIEALFQWSSERGMWINLNLAIWELTRTKPIEQCLQMVSDCTESLKYNFGISTPSKMWLAQTQYLYDHRAQANKYVTQLAEYLIVIKYFYLQPGKFEEKCRMFAEFISNFLPVFRISFLAGCLYFFSKQNSRHFERKAASKWQSDMDKNQKLGNWSHACNVASDMKMLSYVTYIPFPNGGSIFDVPYIATSDKGLSGLLSELSYFGIDVDDPPYAIGHGIIGYRNESIARAQILYPTTTSLWGEFFSNFKPDALERELRLANLSEASKFILDFNFDNSLKDLTQHILRDKST